jgi:1-pyrroline-5-carboxylate dehydrogenase
MISGIVKVPKARNEPVLSYAPGSAERIELKKALKDAASKHLDIPMIINGKKVTSGKLLPVNPPHDFKHELAQYHQGDASHVKLAIDAALKAQKHWMEISWEQRAAIFLKAADLISGPYRARMNAATMLCQSKNVFQSEIDAVCELADFFRFNVNYMTQIYNYQPISGKNTWDFMEWRPLEGFVFALTPFNFTSIAGNLPTAPAIMGNVVVWKPSKTQVYSASLIMEILLEAGLPDGVINLIYAPGPETTDVVLKHPYFAGIHFTGSTEVFGQVWKKIGENIRPYKAYPRIVGETGGKDFVVVHESANVDEVVVALARGAFEYQGQKCSAVSRAYIPKCLWKDIHHKLEKTLKDFKMGGVEDFSNFINAVIDESSFYRITSYIEQARKDKDAEIIIGGGFDKTKGYFIEPTVILAKDPHYRTMEEEIFGPVLTIYVYDENNFEQTLDTIDKTSIYGLTGAIFAKDRYAIEKAMKKLVFAAGNFYINDKPTGAVVGQQPFGGARGSGTNDKAGSMFNLLRWVSPRVIKENFVPPTDYRYPFMVEE